MLKQCASESLMLGRRSVRGVNCCHLVAEYGAAVDPCRPRTRNGSSFAVAGNFAGYVVRSTIRKTEGPLPRCAWLHTQRCHPRLGSMGRRNGMSGRRPPASVSSQSRPRFWRPRQQDGDRMIAPWTARDIIPMAPHFRAWPLPCVFQMPVVGFACIPTCRSAAACQVSHANRPWEAA
jgi:hypothetical protein